MAKDGANALLLTKLDDLMWLFNIRGCDVECNPVAMSYGYITESTATLFIQQKALDVRVTEYLAAHRIEVKEYDTVVDFLKALLRAMRSSWTTDIAAILYTRHCRRIRSW